MLLSLSDRMRVSQMCLPLTLVRRRSVYQSVVCLFKNVSDLCPAHCILAPPPMPPAGFDLWKVKIDNVYQRREEPKPVTVRVFLFWVLLLSFFH